MLEGQGAHALPVVAAGRAAAFPHFGDIGVLDTASTPSQSSASVKRGQGRGGARRLPVHTAHGLVPWG